VAGVSYFIIRITGKYLGAYLGCLVTKTTNTVRNFLGLALLGRRILPASIGNMLLAIILSSSVLYELAGSACAKIALIYSGAIEKASWQQPKRRKKGMP
jgi:hypothetical protein